MSNRAAGTALEQLESFEAERKMMNERIFALDHLGINRFFSLDNQCYRDGALDAKTKELLGLVSSLVRRCDDCVDYHLVQCTAAGYSDEELHDALNVGLVVGGSIVIPHLRHAVATIGAIRSRGVEGE